MTDQTITTTFRAGGYKVPASITYKGNRAFLKFPFNRGLIKEVKMMEGARWHPEIKQWSIASSMRNTFQLSYLMGNNPYERYDRELDVETIKNQVSNRGLRNHQYIMVAHLVNRLQSVLAADMGTGKTLAAIEAVEWFDNHVEPLSRSQANPQVWYIGPVAGVRAVRRELLKWDHTIPWKMLTYDKLGATIAGWVPGTPAPMIVIFDESTKIKNPTAKRSQAALHLANSVRDEWGDKCLVTLMSGSPAPLNPTDWWHQCETACPGFLIEGTIGKLKRNLSLIEERESITGGVYPHLVTWLDDDKKCKHCGRYESEHGYETMDHTFEPARNEVSRLYKRMDGLVLAMLKKDCMDLPEKMYDIIAAEPTMELLRTADSIKKRATSALKALNLLRELSDGFQYQIEESGYDIQCERCCGTGLIEVPIIESPPNTDDVITHTPEQDNLGHDASDVSFEEVTCPNCDGTGVVPHEHRVAKEIGSPKDAVINGLMDECEDVGRIIIWAGFTGTVDRLINLAQKAGWAVLRVDGRGYKGLDHNNEPIDANELLSAMDLSDKRYDELKATYPRIAFIGHPKAGGMALTLTAAPMMVYYSNSYDGEARIQSEDRAHRLGMDENRGLRIIDLVVLPSDIMVIQNLKKKKKLQSLTMGEIEDAWADAELEIKRYSNDH